MIQWVKDVIARAKRPPMPAIPHDHVTVGLKWIWRVDKWIEVCDTCGGNCGQCGITGRVGNPGFSLDEVIKTGGWDKNPPAGLGQKYYSPFKPWRK